MPPHTDQAGPVGNTHLEWSSLVSADILPTLFPDAADRYFIPMKIGSTPQDAEAGANLILTGLKTATSSAPWHYPDGRTPFVGALSVLLDGADRPRGVVETVRVERMAFSAVGHEFSYAYGEGPRTLAWWRSTMGQWYRAEAARHGQTFDENSPIICEWFKLVRNFEIA